MSKIRLILTWSMALVCAAAASAEPVTFVHGDERTQWRLSLDGQDVQLVVTSDNTETSSSPLQAGDGDVEIRDLPDGSAVPAIAHRGELGMCSVTADIGLEREAAWVSLYDCVPDSTLPGNWRGMLTLLPETVREERLGAWAGHWTATNGTTDASIDVTGRGDRRLHVYGLATRQVSEVSIHYAEFEAVLAPEGNVLVHDAANTPGMNPDDACRVKLELAGEALNVNDNKRCGGRGTSFDGSYRRETATPER